MIKVVILYAPQDPAVKRFAETVQKAFDKKTFKVTVKSASQSQMPDITAADAVILGSKADDGTAVHSDFSELMRAFTGVNLSGRCAAFFGSQGTKTAHKFADALADSDISVFESPLVFQEKGAEAQKIKRWAAQFAAYIRKKLHE
jgi:flavodoxin